MQLASCENIIQVNEAFDFRNCLWIIEEIMDSGIIKPMLEELKGAYSEGFCKYSLFMTLKGLVSLHRKNIIQRDFMSDNIMIKPNGDIKIFGFSRAVILTK